MMLGVLPEATALKLLELNDVCHRALADPECLRRLSQRLVPPYHSQCLAMHLVHRPPLVDPTSNGKVGIILRAWATQVAGRGVERPIRISALPTRPA